MFPTCRTASRFMTALPGIIFISSLCLCSLLQAEGKYVPPASPRITYNFNAGWKFIKQDAPGAENPDFDDSNWDSVSTPHTYNDADSFDQLISRSGEVALYMGPACYRKRFKLPAGVQGGKVFLEFEGMRQAGWFFVNGKAVGKYENGVTPCGVDITDAVYFGDKENVLTVKVTNVTNYKEEASGTVFQWESKDFNPNYGGLNRNVWLHVTGKVYQTLPLYENLQTSGTYVYATDIDVPAKTATITVESQVRNESGDQQAVTLSGVVVDAGGFVRAVLKGEPYDMVSGETAVVSAAGNLMALAGGIPSTRIFTTFTVCLASRARSWTCKRSAPDSARRRLRAGPARAGCISTTVSFI